MTSPPDIHVMRRARLGQAERERDAVQRELGVEEARARALAHEREGLVKQKSAANSATRKQVPADLLQQYLV